MPPTTEPAVPDTTDPAWLADRLRAHAFVNDAEVMTGPNPGELTVFLVPQGFRPGPELRDIVLGLVEVPRPQVQVVVGWTVPLPGRIRRARAAKLPALQALRRSRTPANSSSSPRPTGTRGATGSA